MKETTASTLALEKGSKMQQTVAKAFTQSGVGLHTGLEVQRVLPAAGNWALLCAGGYGHSR